MKCDTCKGSGKAINETNPRLRDNICYKCNGSGIQPEQPEIDYSHPATPLIAEIKSKSVQKRLAVQKPEQQVEDNS